MRRRALTGAATLAGGRLAVRPVKVIAEMDLAKGRSMLATGGELAKASQPCVGPGPASDLERPAPFVRKSACSDPSPGFKQRVRS